MLAHWDQLPKGDRLRRAAQLYWRMLREDDDRAVLPGSVHGARSSGVTAGHPARRDRWR